MIALEAAKYFNLAWKNRKDKLTKSKLSAARCAEFSGMPSVL